MLCKRTFSLRAICSWRTFFELLFVIFIVGKWKGLKSENECEEHHERLLSNNGLTYDDVKDIEAKTKFLYFQSLTEPEDLWFIDNYPKEINGEPIPKQLLKDAGLLAIFKAKFKLMLEAKMDIRRLRVENPDYHFDPYFSAILAQEKEVRSSFVFLTKMTINKYRANKKEIPRWSVLMLGPTNELYSSKRLRLLEKLDENENYMICETKKTIVDYAKVNKTIVDMLENGIPGWYIKNDRLRSLMNSPVEICEGGFIISTSFLIRLESLGLMIAPLAHILDRKLAMTGWWFESNGLFDPIAFWIFNLANNASISNFDGYSLKMVSLGELEDAEKPDNSVLPEHFVEHEHLKDNFIRMKPLVKEPTFASIVELPEHFIKNSPQKPLDFLITPPNACSEKRPLLALIKTSNPASPNRHWVREMFKSLLPENEYYLYFLIGYEIEEVEVFEGGKPFWVVREDAPKISSQIEHEAKEHGDIILADFADTYDNLPIKTLSGYQFLKDYCTKKYDIVSFTDDDTFLDLPNIIKYAKQSLSPNKAQFRCLKGSKIEASSAPYSGKYFVFPDIWPPSHIPPAYCNGQCSLLTRGAAEKIIETAENTARHEFRLEDFYFAGILRQKAKITDIKGITVYKDGKEHGFCKHLGVPLTNDTLTPLLQQYQNGTLRIPSAA